MNGRELIGKAVMMCDDIEQCPCVKGLVLDASETHVTGFLVDDDEGTRRARVLPLGQVRSYGQDQILVRSCQAIEDVDLVPNMQFGLHHHESATGTRLLKSNGSEVGTIEDLSFDETTGNIDSFEVAEKNSWAESLLGHDDLLLHEELTPGVIVHSSEIKQIESDLDRMDEAAIRTSDSVRSEAAFELLDEQHSETTVPETPPDHHRSAIGLFASGLWESTKHTANEIYESASRVIRKHHIQQALGRRVTRSVLDSEGQVVVEAGEVVTLAAIERARRAGALEILLNSVSTSASAPHAMDEFNRTQMERDEWRFPFF